MWQRGSCMHRASNLCYFSTFSVTFVLVWTAVASLSSLWDTAWSYCQPGRFPKGEILLRFRLKMTPLQFKDAFWVSELQLPLHWSWQRHKASLQVGSNLGSYVWWFSVVLNIFLLCFNTAITSVPHHTTAKCLISGFLIEKASVFWPQWHHCCWLLTDFLWVADQSCPMWSLICGLAMVVRAPIYKATEFLDSFASTGPAR